MKVIKKQIPSVKLVVLGVFVSVFSVSFAQDWVVTNVAGTGVDAGGDFIDGVDGLSTPIGKPAAMATDADGNIYFTVVGFGVPTESGIFKISISDNTITRVIDGVPGISGIAIDSENNIYFSRGATGIAGEITQPEYIYKIPADGGGVVEIAGTGVNGAPPITASDAGSNFIGDAGALALDNNEEYLYYAARFLGVDGSVTVNYIQRIELSTLTTERYVGIGAGDGITAVEDGTDALTADIAMGLAMGWDSEGIFYFATYDHQIKKVVDGKIYHVAGTGSAGYSGDNGPAADAQIELSFSGFYINDNDELLLSDSENNVIRKIILSKSAEPDGNITTVCGTGFEEGDDNPEGNLDNGYYKIALEANMKPFDLKGSNGYIFFTDDSYRIRRIENCTASEINSYAINPEDVCNGDVATISIEGDLNDASNWTWYEDECIDENIIDGEYGTSIEVTVNEDKTYYVKGTGGCAKVYDDCFAIEVVLTCKSYYNTFTPNGDGKNDFLEIPALENYLENTVSVFNRWGDLLVQIENYDNTTVVWEGVDGNSSPVDPGTYYFTAESGGVLLASGWVQLIK